MAEVGARVAPRAGTRDAYIVSPEEAAEMVPIIDPTGLYGALFDPHEGTSTRTAPRARTRSPPGRAAPSVIEHNRGARARATAGRWLARRDRAGRRSRAEHIVNAGGLWARRSAAWSGVDHPLDADAAPLPGHR